MTLPSTPALSYEALCKQVHTILEDRPNQTEPARLFAVQLVEQLSAALGVRAVGGPLKYGGADTGKWAKRPDLLEVHQVKAVPDRGTPGYRWHFELKIWEPDTTDALLELDIPVWFTKSDGEGFDVKVAYEAWDPGGKTFARHVVSHVQNAVRDACCED